mgnify:CR=1 FL=1|tara:strand:+ start:1564 stop:2727 length:1164 start_codon:yes stop_codon:yes gene_type:complete
MRKQIPYGRQSISGDDIKNVNRILKSDYLTQGPTIEKLERKISKFCKSKYSVAVNSATSALHISCLALGLKKNQILWTSPISFTASANCALHCGAKVDFIDIDLDTFNICPLKLEQKLKNTSKKKRPSILVVVHLGGLSCDMIKIKKLSQKYKFKIIEDASHAIGSKQKNVPVGSCKYSDIAIFSFHPVKIITTGEGGVITTNQLKLYETLKLLREHGIQKNQSKIIGKVDGPWFYQQQNLGFNFRMSDIHAILGVSQIRKVKNFLKIRQKIAKLYIDKLSKHPIKFQKVNKDYFSSYHLFIIRVSKNIRLKLFNYLRKKKINVNLHYIPIYKHIFYKKKFNFKNNYLKNSEEYYKSAISIPIYPGLKKKNQIFVIKVISNFFKNEK